MARMFERQDKRTFNYKPVFWDATKEEREERERRAKAELNIQEGDGVYVPHMRGRFKEMYQLRKEARKGYNGRYAVRMFLILAMMFLLAFFLFSRYAENILQFMGM
ncbi:MAG: hypothetical protein LIO65_05360 [Odoribacter sp.]|nr:hypothetical protein [Odoribacter sp.]